MLITDKDKYRRMNVSGYICQCYKMVYSGSRAAMHIVKEWSQSLLWALFYSTRLASFYPEGNMPEGTLAGDGLPFFTPSIDTFGQSRKTLCGQSSYFPGSLCEITKFEIAFEYTFDKNIYDYSWYAGSVVYILLYSGKVDSDQ